MSTALALNETMSGWMKLDSDAHARELSFSISAISERIFSLTAPRAFTGTVHIEDFTLPCHGELTIVPTGPHYRLFCEHPELGRLRIEGKKTYQLSNLVESLTTCPLEIFQSKNGHENRIGNAEVAYRDSMLAFPFKALRLVRQKSAHIQ